MTDSDGIKNLKLLHRAIETMKALKKGPLDAVAHQHLVDWLDDAIEQLKAIAETDAVAQGDTSLVSGVSSEHTPPHPEPDRQPPSDGGLLAVRLQEAINDVLSYCREVGSMPEALTQTLGSLVIDNSETILAALRANPPTEPVASGRYEFPYQRTFESIARSVTVHPNGHFGISVEAFQERFNKDGVVLATPTPEGGEQTRIADGKQCNGHQPHAPSLESK